MISTYKILTVLFLIFSQYCYSQEKQANDLGDSKLNQTERSEIISDIDSKGIEKNSQEVVKESANTDVSRNQPDSPAHATNDNSSRQSTDSSSADQNSISPASTLQSLPNQSPTNIPIEREISKESTIFSTSSYSEKYNLYIFFGLAYIAIIAALRYSTKNPKAAIYVIKLIYFTFAFPVIAVAYLFRYSMKRSGASTSNGNRGSSQPTIVFDDPHVVAASLKRAGNSSWTVRYGPRNNPSAHEMTITSSTHGGNVSVYYSGRAHNIRYTINW